MEQIKVKSLKRMAAEVGLKRKPNYWSLTYEEIPRELFQYIRETDEKIVEEVMKDVDRICEKVDKFLEEEVRPYLYL